MAPPGAAWEYFALNNWSIKASTPQAIVSTLSATLSQVSVQKSSTPQALPSTSSITVGQVALGKASGPQVLASTTALAVSQVAVGETKTSAASILSTSAISVGQVVVSKASAPQTLASSTSAQASIISLAKASVPQSMASTSAITLAQSVLVKASTPQVIAATTSLDASQILKQLFASAAIDIEHTIFTGAPAEKSSAAAIAFSTAIVVPRARIIKASMPQGVGAHLAATPVMVLRYGYSPSAVSMASMLALGSTLVEQVPPVIPLVELEDTVIGRVIVVDAELEKSVTVLSEPVEATIDIRQHNRVNA